MTDVREVWFVGCHCGACDRLQAVLPISHRQVDVGGGSVPNGTRNNLARIPLRWMIRECFRADTGIQFFCEDVGLDPDPLLP
jgi:hypothetical protein